MADNIKVVAGVGGADPAVATDDIAGVHYQKTKVIWGADGTVNETTDTDGIRLPVGGAQIGALTETVPASDTASSGLNGRLQRLAQNLTSQTPLMGAVNETAPVSDIANSGLNGRLQRIAQRLTSLIALLPTSLGQKTMANSLGVVVASDQSAVPASQSGTWTVQPGNTANTTAWKVDGSAVTQPVSGTVTANAGTNASTAALAAATAVDAGDEAATDEAIVGAATNTRLIGFSARETTGTAGAVFNIRAGTSNAGALLVTVSLGANESAREWYGPDGIAAAAGIWLERVTGQTSFVGYFKIAS